MATKAEFYQSHLDRVSRSFALCIAQLPAPLREWVGLSYLLCRVVDTVEDAAWPTPDAQFAAFAVFDAALLDSTKIDGMDGWITRFPADITEGERHLLTDAVELMDDYHRLPPVIRDIMKELIHTMSQGMQHFCRTKKGGVLRLATLAEVNQYCFFVAGVVGELLTKLIGKVEPRLQVSAGLLVRSHHFGLFLQKVNLLKDQVGDEKVGRHLIPSREKVEESAHPNAVNALEFLLALPAEQAEFRRFCAWSLFLGIEALSVARSSIAQNQVLKVSRDRMQEILAQVEETLLDETGLRRLFARLIQPLGWGAELPRTLPPLPVPTWLLEIYRGPVESARLQELGVAAQG